MHLVTGDVRELHTNGIVTESGDKVDLDVIILATGFDLLSSVKPFNIVGTNKSTNLGDIWGDCPRSFTE